MEFNLEVFSKSLAWAEPSARWIDVTMDDLHPDEQAIMTTFFNACGLLEPLPKILLAQGDVTAGYITGVYGPCLYASEDGGVIIVSGENKIPVEIIPDARKHLKCGTLMGALSMPAPKREGDKSLLRATFSAPGGTVYTIPCRVADHENYPTMSTVDKAISLGEIAQLLQVKSEQSAHRAPTNVGDVLGRDFPSHYAKDLDAGLRLPVFGVTRWDGNPEASEDWKRAASFDLNVNNEFTLKGIKSTTLGGQCLEALFPHFTFPLMMSTSLTQSGHISVRFTRPSAPPPPRQITAAPVAPVEPLPFLYPPSYVPEDVATVIDNLDEIPY